ncbi:MAG TPA: type II secretion system protein GspG [Pyrinomonadaceae bacterium]|nr:type II secretion system protein GspG [Pyrinomonadaceae bacterium]
MNFIASSSLKIHRNIWLLFGCVMLALVPVEARADLSNSQARKVISKMAGLEFPGSSIRIKTISNDSKSSAEVAAEIKTVFKFAKDTTDQWRVREVRIGPDRWLNINHIASALNTKVPVDECSAPDPPAKGSAASDPSVKRARCLLASLLGITLPSDQIRIREVSPFEIPLAPQPSAIVEALVTISARVVNEGRGGWQVSEVRTGSSDWIKLPSLATSVDLERREHARGELVWMAEALEKFRKDRGFYVVSDSQAAMMDHLSPKYLPRVIRIDPWQHPYKYQGEHQRFVLRSVGPDGKDGTGDDVEITSPSR